jgi:RNA-binding protein
MPSKNTLPGHALRYLRGLGHELVPVMNIGKGGITPGLVTETGRALLQHELIKVRVQSEAPVDRKDAAVELADACTAVLAQVIGRTFLLYKRHPKKPKIVIPKVAVEPSEEEASSKKGSKKAAKKAAKKSAKKSAKKTASKTSVSATTKAKGGAAKASATSLGDLGDDDLDDQDLGYDDFGDGDD